MRRIMVTTALVLALIFGYAVARSMADEMTVESTEISEMENLLGATVMGSQGEDLGVIIDFVKDSNDRAVFAILVYGDQEIYGDFGRQVAIPFGALFCMERDCFLNASKDRLDSAPTFVWKDDLAPEMKLAEDVYRHFGMQPYWTEEEAIEHEFGPEYDWR
jgi:sporulation protein YlmC with PRC-barrel domain